MSSKKPAGSYRSGLSRFLRTLAKVRQPQPHGLHLWRVVDSVAFQDTEMALETELYNARQADKD